MQNTNEIATKILDALHILRMNMMEDSYNFRFKIVLIELANSSAEKRNFVNMFPRRTFKSESKSTIGIEFANKNVIIDEKIIKAQIWDCTRHERFRLLRPTYYQNADGAVITYDICNQVTFLKVKELLNEVKKYANPNVIIMLIGNKKKTLNCSDTISDSADVLDLSKRNDIFKIIEVSNIDTKAVENAFDCMVGQIYHTFIRTNHTVFDTNRGGN